MSISICFFEIVLSIKPVSLNSIIVISRKFTRKVPVGTCSPCEHVQIAIIVMVIPVFTIYFYYSFFSATIVIMGKNKHIPLGNDIYTYMHIQIHIPMHVYIYTSICSYYGL